MRKTSDYTPRPMWILYQLAMAGGLLLAAPFLLLRRGGHYLATLAGRLGRRHPPAVARGALWIHAVSVGEVGVAATLARALPEDLPLLITTVTPTGQERAHAAFGPRSPFAGRAVVTYLPFDLGFAVGRFYRHFEPAALLLVEGDYWPLVLHHASRRGLAVAVVNGRVSQRSFVRLRRVRWLLGLFFDAVGQFALQTEEDRQRLADLGVAARRLAVTGNLKFETEMPAPLPALECAVEQLAKDRPILLAGSTMQGEEALVLDAFAGLGGSSRALLILVPRHPERWDSAVRRVEERGLSCQRRSTMDLEAPALSNSVDVLLLDSLGELAALYRLATACFIGGTLVPTGGHNPLEAARFAVPTVVGPSMFNFRQIAELYDQAKAWRRAADADSLASIWAQWLDDPASATEVGQRAAALIAANRGALQSCLQTIDPLLATVSRQGHR